MNAKEEAKKVFLTEPLKMLVGYVIMSLSPFFLSLIPQIRDWFQSAAPYSLLLKFAGALLTALLLSGAYIFHLRKEASRLKEEQGSHPFFKFNVWWGKDHNPLCPTCKTNLLQSRGAAISMDGYSSSRAPFSLWCFNCNKPIDIVDDTDSELSLAEAKKRISNTTAT